MKKSKRYILLFFWIVFFSLFVWLRLEDAYSDRDFYRVVATTLKQNKPAGEIIAGFRLTQPVNRELIDKEILEKDAASDACVSVLLANYADRLNKGTFAFSLQAGDKVYRTIVDAKIVRDNDYRRFCFDGVSLSDIAAKPTALILEGIDSPRGKAITAWMTKDTAHGGAVLRDGMVSDRSLTFRIEVVRRDSKKRVHAIILTLMCGLSGALIILGAVGNNKYSNR